MHGDILDDALCARALRDCDILFHLAARVAIRSSFDFVVEDTLTNVCGTASLLKTAIKQGGLVKIISASSMGVYSDNRDTTPIPETHPADPVSPYGISKLALEQLTHRMAASGGLQSTVLRLFNTYGPGQRLSPYVGVITIFVNALRAGEQPSIFGDGNQARDFVHVDDVVAGFLAAMESPQSGETFNIGTGIPHTVNQVYEVVARVLACGTKPRYAPQAAGELRYAIADITKARAMLGYHPRFIFEDSIETVIRQMENRSRAAA